MSHFEEVYDPEKLLERIALYMSGTNSPALYHYYDRDYLWELFEEAISNITFMKVVFFNNDYLRIAPVHTFASYYIDGKHELNAFEKNSIGRMFKFVFGLCGYKKEIRVYRSNHSICYAKVFVREV